MLKKYRQFFIGFLISALLFGAIPVGAAVQEYILTKSETKIIVDGTEFADDSLPVLNYKGYNYIPAAVFKGICAKLGLNFEWVGETNEIKISMREGERAMSETAVSTTVQYTTIDGKEYINIEDVRAYCKELYGIKYLIGYGITRKGEPRASIKTYEGLKEIINSGETNSDKLIESGDMIELNVELINDKIYITKETFDNILLPFINKHEAKQ